jgi:tight adherence protein C
MTVFIGLAILIVVSVSLISYSFIGSRNQQRDVVARRLSDQTQPNTRSKTIQQDDTATRWFKEKAAPILAKPVKPKSAEEQSNLKIKLANAGFRKENVPMTFLACKSIFGVGLLILTLVFTISSGMPIQKIFGFAAFAGGLGFMLPDGWLYLTIKGRQEKLTYALPDCLDLMVVSVEAGLGLDAAMMKVSQEMGKVHPELAEEFMLVNMEIQMGLTRSDALSNIAIRTGVPAIRSLSAILVQAEKFGTSIASALRTHAEGLRTKRRQEAEERAAKTAVKLVLPLILFIFPAIFVVLAGPAVLKLFQVLSSGVLQGM